MDIDRLQRTDIDKVTDDRITLALDSFNTVRSPYVHETFDDYKCNNWVLIEDEFVKYNLAEDDYLTLVYDPISNLSEKDIKKIIVSFDYELEDYDSLPILDNVSLLHDSIDYLSTNLELNDEMHMDIDCLLFGIDNEVLNNIISERGFGIGLNFNGNKSNATLKLSKIHLSFEFANKLSDETDAVVNRLIPEVDFWREGSKLYLQVGGVDKSKEHESRIDSYTKEEVDELLLGKVNIEFGKGLSANDYTLSEKNKLQSIENGANNYVHPLVHNTNIIVEPNALVNIGTDALDNQETINSAIDSVLEEKADISSFGAVALSNDYDDLDNKPLIPENISDLNNDSDFITTSETVGLIKNDGSIDTTRYLSQHQDLSNYLQKSNVNGLVKNDGGIDQTNYSTFSGDYNDLINKPNIPSGVVVDLQLDSNSDDAVANSAVCEGLEDKADSNHTHESLLSPNDDGDIFLYNVSPQGYPHGNPMPLGAFLVEFWKHIYPVGSIYMNINDVDPTILFGGTWERIEDKFLLSKGSSYSILGGTGGEASHSLTSSEMPRHTHTQNAHTHNANRTNGQLVTRDGSNSSGIGEKGSPTGTHHYSPSIDSDDNWWGVSNVGNTTATNKYTGGTGTSESASNGSAHNNMPPYIIVNVWTRIA
ncbi:hypothetical protein [Methanobrevibacter ruminantium]|uniref:phage baseplate protein n=1 Tax=Methanobrevibacter ruminantium TaxID=83816 RepID=UPI0026E9D353|nr:hypothetical protein [Methanobrevibacter ruminantium]